MKSKLLLILIMMTSTVAFAESYVTFVDVLGLNTVALTLHQVNGRSEVNLREVTVNAKKISDVKVSGSPNGQILIVTGSGQLILEIPANVQRSDWSMQDSTKTFFKDGDSRILNGEIILNGRSVSRVLQIYAAE